MFNKGGNRKVEQSAGVCENEQKKNFKQPAVHKAEVWTISSNKEWFLNQGGFYIRKAFSNFFLIMKAKQRRGFNAMNDIAHKGRELPLHLD